MYLPRSSREALAVMLLGDADNEPQSQFLLELHQLVPSPGVQNVAFLLERKEERSTKQMQIGGVSTAPHGSRGNERLFTLQ